MSDAPCVLCGRAGSPMCSIPLTFGRSVPICRECFGDHVARRLTPLSLRLQLLIKVRAGECGPGDHP